MRSLLRLLGINRAVFFAVLSKVWFAVAGAVTLLLVALFFSPELQGYYFTFYSLLALQVFVELGLTLVIINFSSHEWSRLGFNGKGEIIGQPDALMRLKGLAKVAFRWYTVGGLILALCLGIAGYVFFSQSRQAGVDWTAPWITLCLLIGVNFSILPAFSLLEGCNQVSQVYFFRFIQEFLRAVSTWAIIILGGGLWALPGSVLMIIVWALVFLSGRYFNYFKTLFLPGLDYNLKWWKEVWPMQWRIAVSALSGYFFFYFFTPVLFHYKGPVEAGQMGMTWSMVLALSMISSMWVITRAPQFGILIAKKDYDTLDRTLFHSAILAVGVAACGALLIFSLVWSLYAFRFPFAERLLPPLPTGFLLAATILMQVSYAQSTYLRAHKREPFMLLSVFSATAMALLTVFAGSRWGAVGITVSYFCVVAFFSIPYGTMIWWKCRNDWHYDAKIIEPVVLPDGGL